MRRFFVILLRNGISVVIDDGLWLFECFEIIFESVKSNNRKKMKTKKNIYLDLAI